MNGFTPYIVIAHKRDLVAFIASSSQVAETRDVYGEGWPEVEAEIVKVVQRADHPPYGADWGSWLAQNLDEMVQEAISIVM